MTGDDDEMFITRTLNVTPKTTEQHLILRSNKSVAYVTNNKGLCSTFYTIKANYWQTRSIANLRGFFATAELLVLAYYGRRMLYKDTQMKAFDIDITELSAELESMSDDYTYRNYFVGRFRGRGSNLLYGNCWA